MLHCDAFDNLYLLSAKKRASTEYRITFMVIYEHFPNLLYRFLMNKFFILQKIHALNCFVS